MRFMKKCAVVTGLGLGLYGIFNTLAYDDACYGVLSCAPEKPYHTVELGKNSVPLTTVFVENHGWDVQDTKLSAIYRPTPFYKAWLEYKDDGKPFSRNNKDAIIAKLDALKKDKKPVLVVTFIHGWHNNADDSGSKAQDGWLKKNAVKFDYFMARQADQLRRLYEQRGLKEVPTVLGIYVGWRGDSITTPGLSYLTIGNRAATADRIGSSRDKDSLYSDLRDIGDAARRLDSESRMLIVGHSLGGRMLTRLHLDDAIKSAPQPFAPNTLAVALEPAIGADCYDQAFTKERNAQDKPSFISITSDDDISVGTVYPWASVPLIKDCRQSSPASGVTIGNYHDYRTHRLTFTHAGKGSLWPPVSVPENYMAPDGFSDFAPSGWDKNWFQLLKPRTLAYTMTDLKFPYKAPERNYNKTDTDFYTMSLKVKHAFGRANGVWNIVTDRNTIDIQDSPGGISANLDTRHNGYVSVNLARLITEYMYPVTPKP